MMKPSMYRGFWMEVAELAGHVREKRRFNDDFTMHVQ